MVRTRVQSCSRGPVASNHQHVLRLGQYWSAVAECCGQSLSTHATKNEAVAAAEEAGRQTGGGRVAIHDSTDALLETRRKDPPPSGIRRVRDADVPP